jgi:hypothetical protein
MASQDDHAQVDGDEPQAQAQEQHPAQPEQQQQEHQDHPKRNQADVWSTRIQRELLALVTDNGDAEARSMLPPFCKVLEHKLDIEAGTCALAFAVEISVPTVTTVAEKDAEDTSYATPKTTTVKRTVVVTLDASLPMLKNADGTVNGVDTSKTSYPFMEPTAVLTDGKDVFPPGSTIQVGDKITMDLDWTPSLHLTDAILNLGLKIKESVLQGEPFHAAAPTQEEQQQQQQHLHSEFPVDEVAKSARRFASSISKGAKGVANVFSPRAPKASSPKGTVAAIPASKNKPLKKKKGVAAAVAPSASSMSAASAATAASKVQIGDEINLLEDPWVEAHGVYSCKAIRRPDFIQDTMARAAASKEKEEQAFRSPTAMFRSFTQSARSVLEESFLMITETHIIELKASKLNLSCGTVTIIIPIDMMAKLKFRRQESVSLFFKPAPDDPLVYMCPDAGDAVHQIQTVLKRYGVKGKHTNAAAHRAINDALELVQEIQTKELALKHDPTVERVNEIMDLYRQSAERFEVAGDIRHEEVVTHMRKFLALPLTTSILDGSHVKPTEAVKSKSYMENGVIPEGEVLETTAAQLDDDYDCHDDDIDDAGPVLEGKEKESDKEFEENMENLLKEGQEDLQKYKMDDGETLEKDAVSDNTDTADNDDLDYMTADLDAMMNEADKELSDLMSS